MFNRSLFILLVLSPLVYLTGGVEHVTPLSIANYLNLPSISAINYLSYLLIVSYVVLSSTKVAGRIMPLMILLVIITSILFRENSIKDVLISFVSQLLILSPLFIIIGCKLKVENKSLIKIVNIYIFYILLCIILHYVFVSYYLLSGVSLPNERAVGIFKNPNHLGVFAIATLILFYQLSLQGVYSNKIVMLVELLIAYVIYISGSRSAQLFFVGLILIHSFFYNRRLFMFYVLASLLGAVLIISSDVGVEKIETLLTKRDSKDIADAGNMRMAILYEMLHNFSFSEILFGKGSGEGSALYITNQASDNEKIIWLDSNINTLTYTFGAIFSALTFLILCTQILFKASKDIVLTYRYLFVAYFIWFINIGEFFPIIFMLLLYQTNNREFNNHAYNNYC